MTDMQPVYCGVQRRWAIPRHDGLGATVIEALLNARQVIYTHELRVRPDDRTRDRRHLVRRRIDALRADASAGRLGPNLEGRDYAAATFEEQKLVAGLLTQLRNAL